MFSGNEWLILVVIALVGVVPVAAIITIAAVAARRTGSSPADSGVAEAAAPRADAGWFRDPTGRHELRYWDGEVWTDAVASGGAVSNDPF